MQVGQLVGSENWSDADGSTHGRCHVRSLRVLDIDVESMCADLGHAHAVTGELLASTAEDLAARLGLHRERSGVPVWVDLTSAGDWPPIVGLVLCAALRMAGCDEIGAIVNPNGPSWYSALLLRVDQLASWAPAGTAGTTDAVAHNAVADERH